MKYEEIDIPNLNGSLVWICDYRFLSIRDKPIRCVPPTEAFLTFKPQIGRLSSHCYFNPIGKSGIKLSKIIPYYDNTAFPRPVAIFDNEQDCREYFKNQVEKIFKDLDEYEAQEALRYKRIRETLKALL